MGKLRVGVIGCGRIAAVYREAFSLLSDQAEVAFAVDKVPERAAALAGDFPGCGHSTRLEDLLAQSLDVVHILTPHHLHKAHTIACLEAGFHVLTEKPIATTMADARAMIGAAKRAGRQLGVIFQNRYIEGVAEAKRLLTRGALGEIRGAWSMLNWWRPPSYYACDWKGTWAEEGGGVIIDQAIHSLDLVRHLMGCEPKSLRAFIGRRVLRHIEVEDVADAAITYENGAVHSFFACNYFTENSPIQIELSAEHGSVHLKEHTVTISRKGRDPYVIAPAGGSQQTGERYWGNYHCHQLRDFYTCIREGRPVPVAAEDAAGTLRLVLDIYDQAVRDFAK